MEPHIKKINKAKAINESGQFRTTIRMREHTLIADEPQKSGGNDEGPSPHELLIAALVSCTTITLRMYASKKGWNLNRVEADAEMERVTESGVQTNNILMKISLHGELDADQRKRLLEISGRCPVHKTLRSALLLRKNLHNVFLMREITKKYSNGEVTIIWKAHVCIHSGNCFRGLPMVFNPLVRPWIKPESADTKQIIAQVKKCPSGALTYEMNDSIEANKDLK